MSMSVKDWLRTKSVMVWPPMQWDLTDDKEVAEAATWFGRQLETYEQFWRSQATFVKYDVKRIIAGPVVPGSLQPLPPPKAKDLQPFTPHRCVCANADYSGKTCHTGQSWNEHRTEMLRAIAWAQEQMGNA